MSVNFDCVEKEHDIAYHASGATANDDNVLPAIFAILEETVSRHVDCC